MKRTFISAAAILAFAATAAHADELTDIQAQAKQLREQNAAMTKRLVDIEKRQKALEAQKSAVPTINPVDAMAADLPYKAAVKAKPVENDDICIKGVCVYGNFDMGLAAQTHGAPFNAFAGGPLDYMIQKNSNGSQAGVAANLMSTSFIGLRGKQEIGDNLYAVFNLQTLFNPASGMNANGLGALGQNNGLGGAGTTTSPSPLAWSNAYGDSSKAGQMFNNAAYFGISSPTYGTFTMGRQSSLSSDLVVNYDALSGSNAWSLITYEGATGGGGATEARILDNSYEYRVNIGPVRLAAEAQLRNGGNSSTGNEFLGNVGFDYQGLSMDVVGGKIYDLNSIATTLSSAQLGSLTGANPVTGTVVGCSLGCMSGTISDNTIFQIAARYTIGPWKFYGGYEHLWFDNPNNPLVPGAFAVGGYNLAYVNNNNYITTRNQDAFWVGVKYSITPTLDVAASYYGIRQGFFTQGAAPGTGAFANTPNAASLNLGTLAAQQAACAANSASETNCKGAEDAASIVLDWRFARHVDMYVGVGYSQRSGGLASGFITTTNNGQLLTTGVPCTTCATTVSSWNPGVGLRYQV